MKLAEALIQRADAQKRIEQLKHRIVRNARVQEGEAPAENPIALIAEVERTAATLVDLIKRINRTNSTTVITDGQTLSDALAERDVLLVRRAAYDAVAQAASVTQDRYMRSEVKFKATVAVDEMQAEADDLARQHRELDARIQQTNWNTDLL
ncbi:MAG TPA: DIP1984 family protein [Blastocatellia bacterium]|nr:DIP1984 family protein [Blastocatellia bacterium]